MADFRLLDSLWNSELSWSMTADFFRFVDPAPVKLPLGDLNTPSALPSVTSLHHEQVIVFCSLSYMSHGRPSCHALLKVRRLFFWSYSSWAILRLAASGFCAGGGLAGLSRAEAWRSLRNADIFAVVCTSHVSWLERVQHWTTFSPVDVLASTLAWFSVSDDSSL